MARSGWRLAKARAITPPRLWPTVMAGSSPTTDARSSIWTSRDGAAPAASDFPYPRRSYRITRRSLSSRATRRKAVLRSSEPCTSTTRVAPDGPSCSATKRSATAGHARTQDRWSCSSSATRCRCASTRGPSTAPPIPIWPTSSRPGRRAGRLARRRGDRRDLEQPHGPRRETVAPLAERLNLTVTFEDGIAEYDRDSASYIPETTTSWASPSSPGRRTLTSKATSSGATWARRS